jgi:hypothetical protein
VELAEKLEALWAEFGDKEAGVVLASEGIEWLAEDRLLKAGRHEQAARVNSMDLPDTARLTILAKKLQLRGGKTEEGVQQAVREGVQ